MVEESSNECRARCQSAQCPVVCAARKIAWLKGWVQGAARALERSWRSGRLARCGGGAKREMDVVLAQQEERVFHPDYIVQLVAWLEWQ